MDVLELDKRAEELRKTKRNGRTDKTSQRTDADSADSGTEARPGFKTARRDLGIKPGPDFQTTDSDRGDTGSPESTRKKPRGIRRTSGRSSDTGSGFTADTDRSLSVGRLEPDGELPLRVDQPEATFENKPDISAILAEKPNISMRELGKRLGVSHETARKLRAEYEESHPKESRPVFPKTGNTLTKEECVELYEPFLQSLEDDFGAIDQWLWTRQKNIGKESYQEPIWSNFDEQESQRLAKLLFKWGQKNQFVAAGVRVVVESGDYVAVGSMFIDRFMKTVEIYRETRKPRQGRRRYAED